uniref:Uncharacterized protein n=1 Tax=Romanomermis culicivorax TaxID=13658 RepID=A0A915JBI0_ROMCU
MQGETKSSSIVHRQYQQTVMTLTLVLLIAFTMLLCNAQAAPNRLDIDEDLPRRSQSVHHLSAFLRSIKRLEPILYEPWEETNDSGDPTENEEQRQITQKRKGSETTKRRQPIRLGKRESGYKYLADN